jgi:hypothetical protein
MVARIMNGASGLYPRLILGLYLDPADLGLSGRANRLIDFATSATSAIRPFLCTRAGGRDARSVPRLARSASAGSGGADAADATDRHALCHVLRRYRVGPLRSRRFIAAISIVTMPIAIG